MENSFFFQKILLPLKTKTVKILSNQDAKPKYDLFLWLQVNFFIWENSPRLLNLTPIFAFGNGHSHSPPPSTQK